MREEDLRVLKKVGDLEKWHDSTELHVPPLTSTRLDSTTRDNNVFPNGSPVHYWRLHPLGHSDRWNCRLQAAMAPSCHCRLRCSGRLPVLQQHP